MSDLMSAPSNLFRFFTPNKIQEKLHMENLDDDSIDDLAFIATNLVGAAATAAVVLGVAGTLLIAASPLLLPAVPLVPLAAAA
ncbi:hypothetical protein [Legionella shakespearei]|uniref:Uncharacterized protein n=1 Tax=Legionella shakespearei DSM 23087 TaxID=1122169 RepID=A0A0W0ZAB9_9GAMM|nr:hypothetical protein [Legionella shakespearei]KTD66061.1 hypothetical protein Lsha_0137 [Legionella shakespearei DSM 23087]